MELDAQKKRELELEKRLRTPKAVLSRDKSTEEDTLETNMLIKTFLAGKFYLYEKSAATTDIDRTELEEMHLRDKILTELKEILKSWVVSVAKQTGMEESLAKDEEARLFTFGSHRLGVNSRGGDIDTLVLCPIYVDRDVHFFEQLFSILQKEPHIEELVKVNDPKVLVPVITMNFHQIPVDLAFAKLDLPKIDNKLKNLNDNNLLAASVDDKMVFSMNGPRNVDMIIQSVDMKEDSPRISNFRTTVKLLKLWAKNRGIYSNAMGYVTGISLAILVAKICQLFPNLKPNKLIQKFFWYYSIWNWDEFPVKIDEIRTYDNMERFNDMQWYDPKSEIGEEKIAQKKKDEFTSPMMVITPAFPVMNATRKVSRTNLEVIKEQLAIGKEIVSKKPVDWKKLFDKVDFFNDYYNFIEVTALANEEREFFRWRGLIESQMIGFTRALEKCIDSYDHPRKLYLHPYPKDFGSEDKDFKFCSSYYYGLKFQKPPTEGEGESGDLGLFDAAYEFISKIWQRKIDGGFETANLRVIHLVRDQLPRSIFEEPVPETKENASTTTTGKRHLDKQVEQDSEYEPVIVKKVNSKEDFESKSTHFSNSSSPKETYTHNIPITTTVENKIPMSAYSHNGENGFGKQDNGKAESKIFQSMPMEEAKVGRNEPMQEIKPKPVVNVPKPVLPTPVVGKTTFKPIDNSSLLKQSDELDDFL